MIELAKWAASLQWSDVPARVREHAVNQILSTLAAVYSGWDSDLGAPLERAFPSPGAGTSRIVPSGTFSTPAHAAMLMASWSMILDYDDVMLGGHTGHSSVLVPLALASGKSGADLLLAQTVANEVAARINMVCAVGSTRGQMSTHLHLIASAAASAKLERLGDQALVEALAFALSYPSQALFPSFLGSDAKALCAAWPIRLGMESVDAVRAGLAANLDVIDGERGFFATSARVPVRDFLGGLGERWHTETNSYKVHPACGYLASALEATIGLVREHDLHADDIESVDVWSSIFTVGMDRHSAPYLDGPRSAIATLTFSTPFTIASAILARGFGPEQLKRSWIDDPHVWELAARVRSRHDSKLTIESMTADIPVGAALRRVTKTQAAGFAWALAGQAFGRGGRWLRLHESLRFVAGIVAAAGESGPMDFRRATKPLGARVEIALRNGRVLSRAVSIPRGFAGNADNVRELMREKFTRAATAVIGARRARETADRIEALETATPEGVAVMLESACRLPLQQHHRDQARRQQR